MTITVHQAGRGSLIERQPVLLPSLVWLLALAAGMAALVLRGSTNISQLLPVIAVASVPAILGVILARIADREWVQIVLMLSWAALALLACLILGFIPMALLFITVPAIACLFEREKLLEGVLIASLIAGLIWFAGQQGHLPKAPSLGSGIESWAKLSALSALLAFGLATLFAASFREKPDYDPARSFWRDGIGGGLFEYDDAARLVATNEQGAKQFSGSIPQSLLEFVIDNPDDKLALETAFNAVRRSKSAKSVRVSHAGSGKMASYDLRITPLASKGWLVHAHDRTGEEAQMDKLRQQGAVAAQDSTDKTLFFAGVSHELRTPLNAIIGFSDMMRSRLFGPLPGKYAEYADLIHESGQHMLDLIGDVLDLSKIDAGRYELDYDTFDAADVIRSSVKMIRPAADAAEVGIEMNLDLDQALLIQADRRAVRQILLNLLSNSVKFSDKGGEIEVDAQAIDGDLELTVSDMGAGMSAEEIARIGEPYTQGEAAQLSDKRGSGLGLSLVRSLTELHKGKMKINSAKGEGTRVKITLPLQAE